MIRRGLVLPFAPQTAWVAGAVAVCCAAIGTTTALWNPAVSVAICVAPVALLLLARYPEAGLVLYATSLVLAGPVFDLLSIPAGYQALSAGALLAGILVLFAVREFGGRLPRLGGVHIAALCLGLILLLGLLRTPSPQYGLSKVEGYVLFDLLLLLGVSLLGTEGSRLKMTVYVAAFLGVVFCVWGLVVVFTQQSGAWTDSALRAQDPIWLGRRLGVFAISLVVLAQVTKQCIGKVLMLLVAGTLVFLMFYTGSRGPVLSIAVVLVLYLLHLSRTRLLQSVLFAAVAAIFLYMVFAAVPYEAQSRFMSSIDPSSEAGVNFIARQEFWHHSLDLFLSHPIMGVGTGGYSYYANGIDIRAYPHNLLLEVGCELGVLGIAALLAFLFAAFRLAGRVFPRGCSVDGGNFMAAWGIGVFVFSLANSMVSGDIYTNSLIWFSSGFMWAVLTSREKETRYSV